jgi:hypothetical protein
MALKRTLGLILSVIITLTGVSYSEGHSKPNVEQIEQIADFTGDGIKDTLVDTRVFCGDLLGERYLFIGEKNGSYVRAREKVDNNNITYFLTDDRKTAYFFDGQYYRESPKQK